jgi:hypothetical protein
MTSPSRFNRRSFLENTFSWSLLTAVMAGGAFLIGRRPSPDSGDACEAASACRGCPELRDCPSDAAETERRLDPKFSDPTSHNRTLRRNV